MKKDCEDEQMAASTRDGGGESSPEMTEKALFNHQSGAGEPDNRGGGKNCGDDNELEIEKKGDNCDMRDDCEMSTRGHDKGNEDTSNCGDEECDRCDIQNCGDENEQNHNVKRHSCQYDDYCAEDMDTKEQDNVKSDRMGSVVNEKTCPVMEQIEMGALVDKKSQQSYQDTRWMERVKMEKRRSRKIKNLNLKCSDIPKCKPCNFRKMTKVNSKLNKRPIKRLQAGPKQTETINHQRLENGLAMEKRVRRRFLEENMEIKMSRAREKFLKEENRKKVMGKKLPALRNNAWKC